MEVIIMDFSMIYWTIYLEAREVDMAPGGLVAEDVLVSFDVNDGNILLIWFNFILI